MESKLLLVFFCLFLCSCKKDVETDKENISGVWDWKTSWGKDERAGISYSSTPNDNTVNLFTFRPNGTFVNGSACVLPALTEGTYRITTVNYGGKTKVLILKSSHLTDTFNLSVVGKQMTLRERRTRVYRHVHEFIKLE